MPIMHKNILRSSISMLMFVMSLFSYADTWTDPSTGLTWTYMLSGGEVSVGGGTYKLPALTKDIATHVKIPSTIAGCPVTCIGDFAFQCCYKLPSVEIPNTVKTIGRYAFSECYKMQPPTLPLSVTDLQEDAFDRCFEFKTISLPSSITNIGSGVFMSSGLTTIVIPDGVKNIGSQAFSFCNDLKMAYISSSVDTVGYGAFKQCYDLSSVVISDGVKHIGDSAFEMCDALTSIDLPSSIVSVGSGAFSECPKLASITLREGITKIGHGAFSECTELTEIVIPSTVLTLENDIFYKCDKLSSVVISAGVTTFWSCVFDHCYGLKTLIIPPSVTTLSSQSFRNCPNLTSIYFRGNAPSGRGVFTEMNDSLVIYVAEGSTGWNGKGSTTLPDAWEGHAIVYGDPENAELYTAYDVVFEKSSPPNQHWETNSIYSMPRFIGWQSSKDGKIYESGIPVRNLVNAGEKVLMIPVWEPSRKLSDRSDNSIIIASTEIKSPGAVSVPASWPDEFPEFVSVYGTDLAKALMKVTGKKDAAGNDLRVWHDYVAGTDPTNIDDTFTARIVIENNVPHVYWSPKLTDSEEAMREYKVFGKTQLGDAVWTDVTFLDGAQLVGYHFLK